MKILKWIWQTRIAQWTWIHVLEARSPGKDNPFKGEWGVEGWVIAIIIAIIGLPVLAYIGASMGSYIDILLFIAGGPPFGDPITAANSLTGDPSRNPFVVMELFDATFSYTFTVLGAVAGACGAILFAWMGGTHLPDPY